MFSQVELSEIDSPAATAGKVIFWDGQKRLVTAGFLLL